MFQVRRRGQTSYEDLMHELEAIEQQLLPQDSALAMNLMVLEAKIRERFQSMEKFQDNIFVEPELTVEEIRDLIPKDLPPFPTMEEVEEGRRRKRTLETAGLAALFAVGTALGVLGLASVLQLALSWIA